MANPWRQEARGGFRGLGEGTESVWVLMAMRGVSVWGDEKFWKKIMVMAAQHCVRN